MLPSKRYSYITETSSQVTRRLVAVASKEGILEDLVDALKTDFPSYLRSVNFSENM